MDLHATVLEALVKTFEVRAVVLQHFTVTDAVTDRVPRGDVGRVVAQAMGCEYSPRFQRRVNQAARLLGLTRINRTRGVPSFVGLKKK